VGLPGPNLSKGPQLICDATERTSNSEFVEQFVDVLLVPVGRDAVRVDVGAGVVAEAGDVRRRQTGADVHQQYVVIITHHSAHRVNADRTRLVLQSHTHAKG